MCSDPNFEAKFEDYRRYLCEEVTRLISYVRVYRRLHERREDRLDEMNISPAFFRTVLDALFSVIIIWVNNLLDEHAERGFYNFLTFIEYNRDKLSVSELQRRRSFPDRHWMLDLKAVTLATINEDRSRIRSLEALPSFKTRRDKFHAHFDKDYFFDRKRFATEEPLKSSDHEKVIELMGEILNRYSAAYDGQVCSLTPLNVDDVDYLLDCLHHAQDREER